MNLGKAGCAWGLLAALLVSGDAQAIGTGRHHLQGPFGLPSSGSSRKSSSSRMIKGRISSISITSTGTRPTPATISS